MIFRSPPINPWNAVLGEKDFIIWSIGEDISIKDENDQNCLLAAKKFIEKTFVRLKITFERSFAKSHSLSSQQWVVRYHEGEMVWKAENPGYEEIVRQAEFMKNRIGQMTFEQISKKFDETNFKKITKGVFKNASPKKILFNKAQRKPDLWTEPKKEEASESRIKKSTVKFLGGIPITTINRSDKRWTYSEVKTGDASKETRVP